MVHTKTKTLQGFIKVFSIRAAGFDRQEKLFELNFFIRKTLL